MATQVVNTKQAAKLSNNKVKKKRGQAMAHDVNTVVFGCCCDKMNKVKKLRR